MTPVSAQKDVSTIAKIIQKMGDLPSAPPILEKAVRLTSDMDSHVVEVAHSIAADQAIAAKVIRMSTSPAYARTRRVSTLDDAIKVVGFKQLKSIIVTASAFQIFTDCAMADLAAKLWHHSFSTAIGSRIIAQRLTSLDKNEAYLAGLLHDIGRLVFLKISPGVYTQLIARVRQGDTTLLSEEAKEFGFDHCDLGEALLQKWGFPANIADATADHHDVELSEPAPVEQLARVVSLADAVSHYIGTDFFEPYCTTIKDHYYLGPNPIEGERLIMIRCDIETEFHAELNLLYG